MFCARIPSSQWGAPQGIPRALDLRKERNCVSQNRKFPPSAARSRTTSPCFIREWAFCGNLFVYTPTRIWKADVCKPISCICFIREEERAETELSFWLIASGKRVSPTLGLSRIRQIHWPKFLPSVNLRG